MPLLRLGRADPGRPAPWLVARGTVRLPEAHPAATVFARSQLHPDSARLEIRADYPRSATWKRLPKALARAGRQR